MIAFEELKNVESEDFDKAISIYSNSFPIAERHSKEVIKERVASGRENMFIGRLDQKIVFMALIWPLQNSRFVLFDFMAVDKDYRDQGIGSIFTKNIYRISQVKDKIFILEVEDPRYGVDKEMRKRRVEFYRRNGAKEMKDVRYILPALDGKLPTDMIIMIISMNDETSLPGDVVKKLFTQIYKELYSRDEDDLMLNYFLNSVPSKVEII